MKPVKLKDPETEKKNKYHNVKTVVDGIKFDSKREYDRYLYLRWRLGKGEITDLRLQVPYVLIPTQRIDGKVAELPLKYIADFVYKIDGKEVVEDSKGVKTRDYINKRKMMLWFHGIRIKEV